jgi:hypothetical protein
VRDGGLQHNGFTTSMQVQVMQVQVMLNCACRAAGAVAPRVHAPAVIRSRAAARLAVLASCLAILWPRPAASQTTSQDASSLFDPARLSVTQTFNFLNTATPNSMSAAAGQTSKHVYTSETEFAYTFTDWYQLAIAVPASLSALTGTSGETASWNGLTVRNLFITPGADKRDVFYGVSVQLGYTPPNAALPAIANTNTQFSTGLTPIIGFHHDGYELILSPTVAFGLGPGAMTALAPAARLTRKITDTFDVGIEYGGTLGQVASIAPSSQQAHIVYGVTDFKLGAFNVSAGVGYGLTSSSNGLAMKLGIGHSF